MGTKRTTKSAKPTRKVKDLSVKTAQAKNVKGGPGGTPWRKSLTGQS